MKTNVAALFLASFFLAAASGEEGPAFRPLFNGKNLDGWVNVNCGPETWTINEEGMLVCTGKPIGELRTDRMHQNFILELEWRHLKPKGNAGVFVWADDITARGQPFIRGVEIQVLENAYGQSRGHTTHGDIFPIHGARMTPENGRGGSRAFPTEERSKPSPEWNHYRIECRDGSVSLAVNGKVVTRGSNASPKKGYICLESEGGVVNYRNIRIAELPDTPVAAEDTAIAGRGYRCLYNGIDFRGWKAGTGWASRDWLMRHEGEAETALETEEAFGGDLQFIVDFTPGKNFLGAEIEIRGLVIPITLETAGKPGSFSRFEGSIREGKGEITQNGKKVESASAAISSPGPLRLKCRGEAEWANVYLRARKD